MSAKVDILAKSFPVAARSIVNQTKSQYRVFNGADGLYFTLNGGAVVGVSRVQFDHESPAPPPAMMTKATVHLTRPMALFFDETNYFNGDPIQSELITSFHSYGGRLVTSAFASLFRTCALMVKTPTLCFSVNQLRLRFLVGRSLG